MNASANARRTPTQSEANLLMPMYLQELGLTYQPEFRFYPHRKWRFDFAVPSERLAVEIEGGIYTQGRHTRGAGYQKDLDKYNAAAAMGWRVFRFSTQDVVSGKAKEVLRWRERCDCVSEAENVE